MYVVKGLREFPLLSYGVSMQHLLVLFDLIPLPTSKCHGKNNVLLLFALIYSHILRINLFLMETKMSSYCLPLYIHIPVFSELIFFLWSGAQVIIHNNKPCTLTYLYFIPFS